MKKILTLVLALAMVMALAVPSFAEEKEDFEVEGSIQMPNINIVMPNSGGVILNPYEMEVKVKDGANTTDVTDTVISDVMTVKNLSDVDLQVSLKVTANVAKNGTVTLEGSSVADEDEEVQAYLWIKFAISDGTKTYSDYSSDTYAAGNGVLVLDGTEQDVGGFGHPVDDDEAASTTNTLQHRDSTSQDKTAANTYGALDFMIHGDTSSSSDWTDNDSVSVKVAFTFTPISRTTAPGNYW